MAEQSNSETADFQRFLNVESESTNDKDICREFVRWVLGVMDKHPGKEMIIWNKDGVFKMRPKP